MEPRPNELRHAKPVYGLLSNNKVSICLCIRTFRKRSWCFVDLHILTHTSNAKCFRNVTLNDIRGLAIIIAPTRGHGRLSLNQVMIKRE